MCPRSIFRMFSADRKRVETALENCNLPSGRVRHRKYRISPAFFFSVVSLFALCLWTGVNLCYSLFLPPFIFLTPPSIYSVICHSDIQPVPSPHETVADCWFTHQFRVAFSACLHRFPQKTNPALLARWQIDAEGKVEVTKGCFIITSLRCLWREAGPSCMEL